MKTKIGTIGETPNLFRQAPSGGSSSSISDVTPFGTTRGVPKTREFSNSSLELYAKNDAFRKFPRSNIDKYINFNIRDLLREYLDKLPCVNTTYFFLLHRAQYPPIMLENW
jgi:hypothetical protein